MSKEQKNPPNDEPKAEKVKIEVLSKKGDVSVVTDGKRVWKEGPEESGIGPRK